MHTCVLTPMSPVGTSVTAASTSLQVGWQKRGFSEGRAMSVRAPRPQRGSWSVTGMRWPFAHQVKPVEFTVHATITTSDLELSPLEVDFGYCTIYEAVRTSINVCNLSLLPQEFGFVGVPKVRQVGREGVRAGTESGSSGHRSGDC